MAGISFADIKKEFDESLGYIQNDISALCGQDQTVNYTVALLVLIGCEVLAEGRGDRKRPHDVFAELLPDNDWKALAKPLYEALRNGLTHKFDTKHLHVDGQSIQIYFGWTLEQVVGIHSANRGTGLFISPRPLGERLCARIDEFRRELETDERLREHFSRAYGRESTTECSTSETAAWKRLIASR
ncbi:MAG: hypothetical protein ABSD27_02260 [Bryobacteraceae bacterium]|jgi:hypothetical protein